MFKTYFLPLLLILCTQSLWSMDEHFDDAKMRQYFLDFTSEHKMDVIKIIKNNRRIAKFALLTQVAGVASVFMLSSPLCYFTLAATVYFSANGLINQINSNILAKSLSVEEKYRPHNGMIKFFLATHRISKNPQMKEQLDKMCQHTLFSPHNFFRPIYATYAPFLFQMNLEK